MKSFAGIVAIFSLGGLLIPFLFRVIWHFLDRSVHSDLQFIVFKLMLLLWPTSLMAFVSTQESVAENTYFLFSMAANVIFYAILGALVWLGWRKHGAFFANAGIGMGVIWWKLLLL